MIASVDAGKFLTRSEERDTHALADGLRDGLGLTVHLGDAEFDDSGPFIVTILSDGRASDQRRPQAHVAFFQRVTVGCGELYSRAAWFLAACPA